ncbi:MAG: hypothetical protein Q8J89_01915 [Caulobacter sp.]|nr:hypothetical protein [Caulobacter sp.]
MLVVVHYDGDDSWAFLDGQAFDTGSALVVSMKTAVDRHPDLEEIAELPPDWSASRAAPGQPWTRSKDEPEEPA